MAATGKQHVTESRVVTPEEWYAEYDALAWKLLGMSGEEFMRRWDAGEFDDIADTPGHLDIMFLASLIPHDRKVR